MGINFSHDEVSLYQSDEVLDEDLDDDSDITVYILNYMTETGYDLSSDYCVETTLQSLLSHERMMRRSGYLHYPDWPFIIALRSGTFIIRHLDPDDRPIFLYILTYTVQYHTYHHPIHFDRGWFSLHPDFSQVFTRDENVAFRSVLDLIEHYREHPLQLDRPTPNFNRRFLLKVPSLRHLCLRFFARVLNHSPRPAVALLTFRRWGLPEDLEGEVREYAFPWMYVRERVVEAEWGRRCPGARRHSRYLIGIDD